MCLLVDLIYCGLLTFDLVLNSRDFPLTSAQLSFEKLQAVLNSPRIEPWCGDYQLILESLYLGLVSSVLLDQRRLLLGFFDVGKLLF